jgi:hypothetical protein
MERVVSMATLSLKDMAGNWWSAGYSRLDVWLNMMLTHLKRIDMNMEAVGSSEAPVSVSALKGVTSQKTANFIFTAVKTTNPIYVTYNLPSVILRDCV